MAFQISQKIPYRPNECPKCRCLLGSGPQGACEAYETPSFPMPLAGQFSGQSQGHCPKYSPKSSGWPK